MEIEPSSERGRVERNRQRQGAGGQGDKERDSNLAYSGNTSSDAPNSVSLEQGRDPPLLCVPGTSSALWSIEFENLILGIHISEKDPELPAGTDSRGQETHPRCCGRRGSAPVSSFLAVVHRSPE